MKAVNVRQQYGRTLYTADGKTLSGSSHDLRLKTLLDTLNVVRLGKRAAWNSSYPVSKNWPGQVRNLRR